MTHSQQHSQDKPLGLLDEREHVQKVALRGQEHDHGPYPANTFKAIGGAMATLAALIIATYVVPAFHWARPWQAGDPVPFWNIIGRELLGEGEVASKQATELAQVEELAFSAAEKADESFTEVKPRSAKEVGDVLPAYTAHPEDPQEPAKQAMEHAEALEPFFTALTQTDLALENAVTRVVHYGDSAIGNDGITSAIRNRMQARFGDAGPGFHLLGQPNASYRHQSMYARYKSPWNHCFIIFGCRKDGHYGLGGTTFESAGGAETVIGTATKGPAGRKVSRFELWYAGIPKGGTIRLKVDDQEPELMETAAEQLEDRWHAMEVEEGSHRFSVRAAGGGKVRAYGVVLERKGPGVVWDNMSQIGAFTKRMLKFDEDHFRRQLTRRKANLVVLMFGGNDLYPGLDMNSYEQEYRQLIQRIRSTKEPTACLIMAPLDHGERQGQRIITRSLVPPMVEAQRRVALEEGCAFFDTYQAMGGEGSMGRWARSNPPLGSGDLAHLTHHGHKVIGHLLYHALMESYIEFRKQKVGMPLSK